MCFEPNLLFASRNRENKLFEPINFATSVLNWKSATQKGNTNLRLKLDFSFAIQYSEKIVRNKLILSFRYYI